MAGWILVHHHPVHHLLLHVGIGEIAQARVAQWPCHDHLFECRHPWTPQQRSLASQTLVGGFGFLGLHRVGVLGPIGLARCEAGCGVLPDCRTVSLLGVLVLRTQPLFLGMAVRVSRHHLVQCAVQWLVKID